MFRSSMSVRALTASVVACVALCVGVVSASAAPVAVVASHDRDEVTVVNTATNEVVGSPIPVGDGPASVAITPDGRYAYVADNSAGTVSVIDILTRQPLGEAIEVGRGPFGVAITPDGDGAFVTDRGSDELSAIDTATREVSKIQLGKSPRARPPASRSRRTAGSPT